MAAKSIADSRRRLFTDDSGSRASKVMSCFYFLSSAILFPPSATELRCRPWPIAMHNVTFISASVTSFMRLDIQGSDSPIRLLPQQPHTNSSSATKANVPTQAKALIPTDLSIVIPEGTYVVMPGSVKD
ncbi:Deoxyuridine 5'-triphosphate nucleotidohydrolase [Apostasia shenzhenica]|uniref:Deoxyuridine 5'-triphosphate nucleotidohydrolase n=1 Tax=Apostasia shenzhenica TaxID=1088818 RepID=A0A2I0BCN7_9ASPA|nr:Deoxyuridine 5'-triphosphate nucleotidohydrolase [Apostasia shenzhenica]